MIIYDLITLGVSIVALIFIIYGIRAQLKRIELSISYYIVIFSCGVYLILSGLIPIVYRTFIA